MKYIIGFIAFMVLSHFAKKYDNKRKLKAFIESKTSDELSEIKNSVDKWIYYNFIKKEQEGGCSNGFYSFIYGANINESVKQCIYKASSLEMAYMKDKFNIDLWFDETSGFLEIHHLEVPEDYFKSISV